MREFPEQLRDQGRELRELIKREREDERKKTAAEAVESLSEFFAQKLGENTPADKETMRRLVREWLDSYLG